MSLLSSAANARCLDVADLSGRVMKLSPIDTEALIRRDVECWTKRIKDVGISAGQ